MSLLSQFVFPPAPITLATVAQTKGHTLPTGAVTAGVAASLLGEVGTSVTNVSAGSIFDGYQEQHDGGGGDANANLWGFLYIVAGVLTYSTNPADITASVPILTESTNGVAAGFVGLEYKCDIGTPVVYEDNGENDSSATTPHTIVSGQWYACGAAVDTVYARLNVNADADGLDHPELGVTVLLTWTIRSIVNSEVLCVFTTELKCRADSEAA